VDLAAWAEPKGTVRQNKSDAPQAIAMQVRENSFRAQHATLLLLRFPAAIDVRNNTLFTRRVMEHGVFHLIVRNDVRVFRRS
jgi:hypothetical protein